MPTYDIAVTDLTRFGNQTVLCLAGLTMDGANCIRPLMPRPAPNGGYLSYAYCAQKNILPGSILRASFSPCQVTAPHIEDMNFTNLSIVSSCTSQQFRGVLAASVAANVSSGFGTAVAQKVILRTDPVPVRSIVTLLVDPQLFSIQDDGYGKLRASFTDSTGMVFHNLAVTDLGFFKNVGDVATRVMQPAAANAFIQSQDEVYLRVGLSRSYQAPDGRDGYWMQINGIYTFPDYAKIVRSY